MQSAGRKNLCYKWPVKNNQSYGQKSYKVGPKISKLDTDADINKKVSLYDEDYLAKEISFTICEVGGLDYEYFFEYPVVVYTFAVPEHYPEH